VSSGTESLVLEGIPMMAKDQGCCTLILALQAALKFIGLPADYDYLMGVSGAGFMFWASSKHKDLGEWCEMMRERYICSLGDALGIEMSLVEPDEALFSQDAEKHFYTRFGSQVATSLEAKRPVLAYGCFEHAAWDVIAGFSHGRLLCRSICNKTSPSGLAEHIQPYDPNQLWPSKIILLGNTKPGLGQEETIRVSLEQSVQIGRGLGHPSGKDAVTGPAAIGLWARRLSGRQTEDAIAKHQRLRSVLIDARVSLERYLRWVSLHLGPEFETSLSKARQKFRETFETLASIDISPATLLEPNLRKQIAARIDALQASERAAFDSLEVVHSSLKRNLGLRPGKPGAQSQEPGQGGAAAGINHSL